MQDQSKAGVVKQRYFEQVPEVAGSNPAYALHGSSARESTGIERCLIITPLFFKHNYPYG